MTKVKAYRVDAGIVPIKLISRTKRPTLDNKTYSIITFGCQMNKLDSEVAAGHLQAAGLTPAQTVESADLLLVNSCSVRAKAQDRATTTLHSLPQTKNATRSTRLVGIMGCVAQQMKEKLLDAPFNADFVIGARALPRLPEIIDRLLAGERKIVASESERPDCDYDPAVIHRTGKRSAYVAVSRGCSNLCTYCIVPYVRGPIWHRNPENIINEVSQLVQSGYLDLCLLGQNVNNYSHGRWHFTQLLERLAQTDRLRRLRFITTHPKDLSIETVKLMAHPPLVPYISMPLQSGSDRILRLMNRGYTRTEYLEKVAWLREHIDGSFISTDIMVGFPGESEADFEDTLEVVRLAKFDNIYSFIYSPRPFTKAASLKNEVPRDVVKQRFKRLLALERQNNIDSLHRFVGSTLEVLVDGASRKDRAVACGRCPQNVVVNLPHDSCEVGELVLATITTAGIHSLVGKVTRRLVPAAKS